MVSSLVCVCVVCGGGDRGGSVWQVKAFMATLRLDPPTALLIYRKSLLAIALSTNTNREIMACRSCCLLLAKFSSSVRTESVTAGRFDLDSMNFFSVQLQTAKRTA